jgi:hypothetical protein
MVIVPNIGMFDICLGLIYLIVIYFVAYRYQQRKIKSHPEYRYFLWGISAKVLGGISFALTYIYFYKGGDTFLYFKIAENIREHFSVNVIESFNLLITSFQDLDALDYNPFGKGNHYYERNTTWIFARFLFIVNVLSFGSYLVSSIMLSIISFIGLWLGFIAISRLYPIARKMMFIPFFLIPTAMFWSSGILRDTLVISVFGLLLYSCSNFFVHKKRRFTNAIISLAGLLVLLFLKPISLFILTPCLIVWGLSYLIKRKFSLQKKLIIILLCIMLTSCVGYFVNKTVLIKNSKYQVEHLMSTLKGFQTIHPDYPIPESVYSLGEMDYTFKGVFFKIHQAINVTFFRPYFWEVGSIGTLIAAIESFLLPLFLILILISVKGRILKPIIINKDVIFLLLFSITYAAVTGLSAYNFGALTRFKIPSVLFFCIALIIIYQNNKSTGVKKED